MLRNYYNMYKKYGFKLIYAYFFYSHFFDIKNRVDTHLWIPVDTLYDENNRYDDHNRYYLGSWSNIIKKTYSLADQFLGSNMDNYSFIDMGCGKGRVLLIWEQLIQKHKRNISLSGIDLNPTLIEIAKNNHRKMFNKEGDFSVQDVCNLSSVESMNENLIIYMFNPFGEPVIRKMLEQLTDKKVMIIYVNPLHPEPLLEYGYEEIYDQGGWHPILQIKVFTNHKIK